MTNSSCLALFGTATAGPSENARALLDSIQWGCVGEHLGLSSRELELVQHTLAGKKMCAIAADMGLALGTVKTYSQRIHRKLNVADRCELVLAVVATHLQHAAATCDFRSGHRNPRRSHTLRNATPILD